MLIFDASKLRYCRHQKSDGICSLIFVVDEFSGLFLHPSIFFKSHHYFLMLFLLIMLIIFLLQDNAIVVLRHLKSLKE